MASFLDSEPRDPERIDRILGLIAEIWRTSPELRLGQLLLNATRLTDPRIYNLEDDRLETALREWREASERR